jgi:hypothetical protein
MAWLPVIDLADADGELRDTYRALLDRPMPSAYRPPHGGAPGIHRAHSLDPGLMRVVFATSGASHQGEELGWAERELISASVSRISECRY